MKYIDAHCHILSKSQIHDAMTHGVERFVVNATRSADWDTVINMTQQKNIYGAIGVHPWYVDGLQDEWDTYMVGILLDNPDLMVGEIGLDKNRPYLETQEIVFRQQLQIAHDMGRVAHIHCVGAWGLMMDILRDTRLLPPAMVFHAFSGAPELMSELAKLDAYFSFGSAIIDTSHTRARMAVALADENRILVESDAPDVTMPDAIPNTIAEIAKLHGKNAEDMADKIYDNTIRMLNV